VWTETGAELKAVEVALGPTDGKVTVIRGGALTAGTPVIVDLAPTNR
jgi:hypothetical protein